MNGTLLPSHRMGMPMCMCMAPNTEREKRVAADSHRATDAAPEAGQSGRTCGTGPLPRAAVFAGLPGKAERRQERRRDRWPSPRTPRPASAARHPRRPRRAGERRPGDERARRADLRHDVVRLRRPGPRGRALRAPAAREHLHPDHEPHDRRLRAAGRRRSREAWRRWRRRAARRPRRSRS